MHLKPFKSMQNLLKIKHPHRTPITYSKTPSLKRKKKEFCSNKADAAFYHFTQLILRVIKNYP